MKRQGVWVGALVLAVSLSGDAGVTEAPDLPHAYMDDETLCIECHQMEEDGEDWLLDPHLFTVSVVDACRSCHPEQRLGRSHPVNVPASDLPGFTEVPEELPLHWSDEQRDLVMTCGTCHNPHLDRFSASKLWSRQRPHGSAGYLTYYLRMRGSTPREGFTPLYHACHPDL